MHREQTLKIIEEVFRRPTVEQASAASDCYAPTVDLTYEDAEPDNEVTVILADGFTARFFQAGLTDDEYIGRTKQIQELERSA